MTKFEKKIANYNETVTKLKAELAEGLKAALQEMLQELPGIKSIRWEAYTPYFNDGEPCVYQVRHTRILPHQLPKKMPEYVEFDDEHFSEYDLDFTWTNGWGSKKVYSEEHKELGALIDKATAFVDGVPKEVMRDCFGDHKQITVTAEQVTVEKYEHE